eukprot:c14036_g1_i1 orf=559-948(+)
MLSPIRESTQQGTEGADFAGSLTFAQVIPAKEAQAETSILVSKENTAGLDAEAESKSRESASLPSLLNAQSNQDLDLATNETQASYEGAVKADSESFKFELGEGKSNPNRGSAFDIKSKIPGLVALTLP